MTYLALALISAGLALLFLNLLLVVYLRSVEEEER